MSGYNNKRSGKGGNNNHNNNRGGRGGGRGGGNSGNNRGRDNNNRNDHDSYQSRGRGGNSQGQRGGRDGRGGKNDWTSNQWNDRGSRYQRPSYIPQDFTVDLEEKISKAKRDWGTKQDESKYDSVLEYRDTKSLCIFDSMREKIRSSRLRNEDKKRLIDLETRMVSMKLPVYAYRDEVVSTCFGNDVSLLTAETGAGKSILTPIFCAIHILLTRNAACPDERIYVSQPRKFAARNIKNQIHKLIGDLGTVVSTKKIDEPNLTDILPKIILTTDYNLLTRIIDSPEYYKEFKIIMIDEAHERSVYIDSLLSMIKTHLILQNEKADDESKKVHAIIASATISVNAFKAFIPTIKEIHIKGQCYEVKPHEIFFNKTKFARDYIDMILDKIIDSYSGKKSDECGHALCFLCGKNEIIYAYDKFKQLCEKDNSLVLFPIPDDYDSKAFRKVSIWGERTSVTSGKMKRDNKIIIYPFILHGQIPPYLQDRILYEDCGPIKKVVFTTNLAETSVTVPGVDRVFDSGLYKIPKYIPENRTEIIITRQINDSSRKQRMGRAGRTCNGEYYQFNWQDDDKNGYKKEDNDLPEIKRRDLSLLLLILRCSGLNLEELDLPDQPDEEYLKAAKRTLIRINAIDSEEPYLPTEKGRNYALYQISPELACDFLDVTKQTKCIYLSAICAAVISIGTSLLYWGSNGDYTESIMKQTQFYNPFSQVVTLMNTLVYLDKKNYAEDVAYDYNINIKFAYSAKDLVDQLIRIKNHQCACCKEYSTNPESLFAKKSLEIANEFVRRHKNRSKPSDCIAIFHNLEIKTTIQEDNSTDAEIYFYYRLLLNGKDGGLYRSTPIGTKLKQFQEMIVNNTLPLRVVYFSKMKTTDSSNTNLLNGFLGLCTKIDSEETDPTIKKVNKEPICLLDQEIYMNILSTFCKPVRIAVGKDDKADIFVIIVDNDKDKMENLLTKITDNFGILKENYYKYFIMNNCPSINQYIESKENCEILHLQLCKDDGEKELPLIYDTDVDTLLEILLNTDCECGYLCNNINMQVTDFTQISNSQIQLLFPNIEERQKYEGELKQINEYDTNINIMNNSNNNNNNNNNNLSQIEESICIEILPSNINVGRDSQILYISYASKADKCYESAAVLNDIYMSIIPDVADESKYNPLGMQFFTCYKLSLANPDYSHSIEELFLKNYSNRKCIPPYGLNIMISKKNELQIIEMKSKKEKIYDNLLSHLQDKDPSPQLRCYERNNELFISYKSNLKADERMKIFQDLKSNIKDIVDMKADVFLEYTITFVIKNIKVGYLLRYVIIFFFGAFANVIYKTDKTSLSIICHNRDLSYSICNYINSILNSEDYLIPTYLLQFNNVLKNPIITNEFIQTLFDNITKKMEEIYKSKIEEEEHYDPSVLAEKGTTFVEDIKKFFYIENENRKIVLYCDNHFKNLLIPIFKNEVEKGITEKIKEIKKIDKQFFFLVPSKSMQILNNRESKKAQMKEDNKKNKKKNENGKSSKKFSTIYNIFGICSKSNCMTLLENEIVPRIDIKEKQLYSLCSIDKEKYINIKEIYNEIKEIYESNEENGNDDDDDNNNNSDDDEEDNEIGLCYNMCDKTNYKYIKCGHKICVDCLTDYITNISSSNEDEIEFKVECKICKRKLLTYEIASIVNEDLLRKLYNKISRQYVCRNKDKYYECPYDDCGRILMKKIKDDNNNNGEEEENDDDDDDDEENDDDDEEEDEKEDDEKKDKNGIFVTCKSCGNISCCICGNKCHFNKSCSGEALPNSDTIKCCPKCGVPTEKEKGCNHIRCSMCTIHWCWECGKYYEISDLLYEHMRNEHGGISFDDE